VCAPLKSEDSGNRAVVLEKIEVQKTNRPNPVYAPLRNGAAPVCAPGKGNKIKITTTHTGKHSNPAPFPVGNTYGLLFITDLQIESGSKEDCISGEDYQFECPTMHRWLQGSEGSPTRTGGSPLSIELDSPVNTPLPKVCVKARYNKFRRDLTEECKEEVMSPSSNTEKNRNHSTLRRQHAAP
jgi:hypothetical protein